MTSSTRADLPATSLWVSRLVRLGASYLYNRRSFGNRFGNFAFEELYSDVTY